MSVEMEELLRDTPPAQVGEQVRLHRIAAGLKQRELAEAVGCSTAYVSRVESGLRRVRMERLRAIAYQLDTTVLNLLGGRARVASEESPEEGHTFRFSWSSRGSYGVVGVEGHTDAGYWDEGATVEVRAWSLAEALRKAARLPFPVLMGYTDE